MNTDQASIQEATDVICEEVIDTHPGIDLEIKASTKKFLKDMSDFVINAKIDLPDKEIVAIGSIVKQNVSNN